MECGGQDHLLGGKRTGEGFPVRSPSSRRYAITNDAFISRGYGLTTTSEDGSRQAVWSRREAKGLQTLYYRGEARRVETREPPLTAPPPQVQAPGFTGADLSGGVFGGAHQSPLRR